MAVSGLDSIIGQSLGGLNSQSANSTDATKVSLSSVNGNNQHAKNTFDRVELSARRPRQIEAGVIEKAREMSDTLEEKGKLGRRDLAALREDRVMAALVGMRLIQNNSELASPIWAGGIPAPTQQELQEAYRRLTQLPADISEAGDAGAVLETRSDLLEKFSGDNFSAYTPKPEPAAASLESEDESRDEVVQSQGQIDNEQADKGASEMAVNAGKELKQEFEGGESMAAA